MSVFEAIMLVCFGMAWPFSIYKSYYSKSIKGKSLPFLVILMIGYVAGIIHKIFFSFDYVLILYVLNMVMVTMDALLYLRNRRLARGA